ncbi:branched-chain amino acid ABC transporter permease [Virgisporangium aurantiacum]|uniref:Branched-chain amino acid ABC transporter permease n=1 Tax=Virgisporangium aurantiacum TaxID=175570 RepID=A0A8J3Z1P8_9ACTN|nr:branched-chain amino acid ABC transporter permease [Virgisporangium aurantiacum]GIJ55664.1 branched-chain amino acid ABC transporter permease [Virgisporangium aurantiacum]
MSLLLDRIFDGVTNGCVYAVMALALVIVFRGSGTINFAQGELALFTTYLAWWLTTLGTPIWVGLIAAAAAGLVVGAGVERLLIRPVRRRNDMAVLIVCLGLFTALNALCGLIWNSETKVMPSIFPNGLDDYVSIGGARLYYDGLGVWLLVLVVVALMFLLFNRTKLGLHMRAVASNAESAALSGVKTGRVLMFGWGVSGAIGAVAGVLVTPLAPTQLGLQTMFPILIYASAAALFGGLDSPLGAVVAGLALGVAQQLIMGYVGFIGDTLPQTAALTIIVAVLVLRPNGLFGTRQLERV